MNKLFRNAEESAEFLGYQNVQEFENARLDGLVPPPDTVFQRMPFWSVGTLEQVIVIAYAVRQAWGVKSTDQRPGVQDG